VIGGCGMPVRNQDRKYLQSATSHKSPCEASRRAECAKSACSVRRGEDWKPTYGSISEASRRGNGEQPTDRTYGEWRHSSTLPAVRLQADQECGFLNRSPGLDLSSTCAGQGFLAQAASSTSFSSIRLRFENLHARCSPETVVRQSYFFSGGAFVFISSRRASKRGSE